VNGRAFKPTDWVDVGLPIIRIQNLNRPNATFNHFDGSVDEKFLVQTGDLLFAWSGTPGTSFGAHIWNGPTAILNQHIFNVRYDGRAVHKAFFRYAINQTLDEQIAKAHGGVGLRHVTRGKFEETDIALPPLAEQRRIVAKLDGLTAHIMRARAGLNRVPALARQMKQRTLLACFGETDSEQVELGALLQGIEAGKNMRCEERPPREGELGVVKVSAVTWGHFDPHESKTLPPDYVPPEKARIRSGDLLISRANTLELVGAVALVDRQPDGLFLSDKILRLVLDDDIKKWVMWFLRSAFGRKQIEQLATGNQLSMRNISQDALRRIRLPLAVAEDRLQLVERIESAFARADRLEAAAARARALLNRLESAILAKAFRGELVPQDPTDEPAEALLERIRPEPAIDRKSGEHEIQRRTKRA
jgi:type I restriction enzyme S subunit